jgi:hypothetical protein
VCAFTRLYQAHNVSELQRISFFATMASEILLAIKAEPPLGNQRPSNELTRLALIL